MHPSRKIYLLDPKKLSPETIAVAFAKTSRSPRSFQEIAEELTDDRSADFHEKWVVGYGHSSVAEHAVLHIALENISRLAVECLESNRLASYTEKSSRYQVWDATHFHIPAELRDPSIRQNFTDTCQMLFQNYQQAVDQVSQHLEKASSRLVGESEGQYKQRLRTLTADVCRYYLPACSLANVGTTINARSLEYAICKMLSHPLLEVRQIGEEIKAVALENIPTLVKYANCRPYLAEMPQDLQTFTASLPAANPSGADWLSCTGWDADGIQKVLAAVLYRYTGIPYRQVYSQIMEYAPEMLKALVMTLIGKMTSHDAPLRELEYASIGFDITLDQGAYFELKRHRMMTQTPQPLTARLGYALPSLLVEAGLQRHFEVSMKAAQTCYERIAVSHPDAASYIVPNAFNRRVLIEMNLRSAHHLIRLRTAANAHFAIRRAALRIMEELHMKYPLFGDLFQSELGETWQQLEKDAFLSTN